MKLHTEMQWTKDGSCKPDPFNITVHSPTNSVSETIVDFVHDTMAAHALLQAIDEMCRPTLYWMNYGPIDETKEWILTRAQDIMREWMLNDEHS